MGTEGHTRVYLRGTFQGILSRDLFFEVVCPLSAVTWSYEVAFAQGQLQSSDRQLTNIWWRLSMTRLWQTCDMPTQVWVITSHRARLLQPYLFNNRRKHIDFKIISISTGWYYSVISFGSTLDFHIPLQIPILFYCVWKVFWIWLQQELQQFLLGLAGTF